jgi:hypothetical protein
VGCEGFNFSDLCSVVDPLEFLNFSDIPFSAIQEMGKRGLSEVEILNFYGWRVLE